jgi:hypothetical protein
MDAFKPLLCRVTLASQNLVQTAFGTTEKFELVLCGSQLEYHKLRTA